MSDCHTPWATRESEVMRDLVDAGVDVVGLAVLDGGLLRFSSGMNWFE
jgi:hypothetical protein